MRLPILCLLAALSGCATQAAVTTTLATAQADIQKAITLYNISKGIAQIAMLADPSLDPAIAAGIAAAEPLVALAQAALTDTSADAVALEALVAQVTAHANALTVQAASVIKVVAAT